MPPIAFALATVAWDLPYLEKLRACLHARTFVHTGDPAEIEASLADADVAILSGDLDARFLAAPKLRWIHCDHAGLNRSARPEVFEKGLLVTSSSGRSAPVLAEHAILFMLALPLSDATHHLIGDTELAWMKPSSSPHSGSVESRELAWTYSIKSRCPRRASSGICPTS